jgi:transposase-like protein
VARAYAAAVASTPRRAIFELDARLEHAIADCIAFGMTIAETARALHIGERTVYRWVARGRAGEPRYERFLDSIEAAQTERASDVEQLVDVARGRIL